MNKTRRSFTWDVFSITTGSFFSQSLGLLVSPILSRLYLPEDYGTYGIFASLTIILGAIACLGFERAIMLPEKENNAVNLIGLSISLLFVFIILLMVMIWLFGVPFVQLINAPELVNFIWFIPPVVFFIGLNAILRQWNSRTRRFGRLSLRQIIHSSVTSSTQLGAGFGGWPTAGSLIISNLLGNMFSSFVITYKSWREDNNLFRSELNWCRMMANIKRYKQFPVYGTLSTLLNTVSWQLPSLLLSFYFSSAVVGFYSQGNKVLRVPAMLVGGSIAQVFYQRAAAAKSEGKLQKVVSNTFQFLLLGMYPMLLLTIIGKELFIVIFGPSWGEAGVYTQILSIWTFFVFISSPISSLYLVLERQDVGLAFNIVLITIRSLSIMIGGWFHNEYIALTLFASTGIIAYGWLCFWLVTKAGVSLRKTIIQILKILLISSPFVLIVAATKYIITENMWIILGVSFVVSLLHYFILILFAPYLRGALIKLVRETNIFN